MRDDGFSDGGGAEMVPAELEPIHIELEEAGAAWRAKLPSSEGFVARIDALLGRESIGRSPASAMGLATRPRPSSAPRMRTPERTASRGRMRGLSAIGAAIAVVGLFAAAFQFASTGSGGPSIAAPGEWSAEAPFRLPDGEAPFVAQGDPRVIYRLDARAIKLERSDDTGATWHALPLPARGGGAPAPVFAALQISPLDARTIFLTLFGDPSASPCMSPASDGAARGGVGGARLAAPPLAGGPTRSCIEGYVSADGGAHWGRLALPGDGLLAEPVFREEGGPHMPLRAQGGRIYAAMLPKATTPGASSFAVRLIASDDGGVAWRLADDALARQGKVIEEFAAAPTGVTVWAATTDHGLWRSEDAGASWTRVGDLPQATPQQAAQLAAASGGAASLVYLQTPGAPLGDIAPGDVEASAVGGARWQRAPSAGIPDGQRADPRSAQVRGDGAVVMLFRRTELRIEFSDNIVPHDAAYYAWKPGATSWTRLTRQFDAQEIEQQWLAASGGAGETIWALVYRDDVLTYNGEAYIKDGTYTLMHAALAS